MINRFRGKWSFLSNFHPCEIEHKGIIYPSVENYYVAMKINTTQIIDGVYYSVTDLRKIISEMRDPSEVKRFGRKFKLRDNWDDKKLFFMNWAVREKFKNDELKKLLLETDDQYLIEGNLWHDNFYGSCGCPKCGDKGENHLGKILMVVRNEIK